MHGIVLLFVYGTNDCQADTCYDAKRRRRLAKRERRKRRIDEQDVGNESRCTRDDSKAERILLRRFDGAIANHGQPGRKVAQTHGQSVAQKDCRCSDSYGGIGDQLHRDRTVDSHGEKV